jgi:hypothetical protein
VREVRLRLGADGTLAPGRRVPLVHHENEEEALRTAVSSSLAPPLTHDDCDGARRVLEVLREERFPHLRAGELAIALAEGRRADAERIVTFIATDAQLSPDEKQLEVGVARACLSSEASDAARIASDLDAIVTAHGLR